VNAKMAEMQNQCYDTYEALKTAAAGENAAAACTEISSNMAKTLHEATLALINDAQ